MTQVEKNITDLKKLFKLRQLKVYDIVAMQELITEQMIEIRKADMDGTLLYKDVLDQLYNSEENVMSFPPREEIKAQIEKQLSENGTIDLD